MVRLYEENEIHKCTTCGLIIRVTLAAVPIEPVNCCGKIMELLGIQQGDEGLETNPAPVLQNALEHVYRAGEKYWCNTCGLEVLILRQAQAIEPLDCCGEGMELLESI